MTKEEFEGVVMIVILSPRKLRAFERSSIGMVWPCAMKGKMTTWGLDAISSFFLFFPSFFFLNEKDIIVYISFYCMWKTENK